MSLEEARRYAGGAKEFESIQSDQRIFSQQNAGLRRLGLKFFINVDDIYDKDILGNDTLNKINLTNKLKI